MSSEQTLVNVFEALKVPVADVSHRKLVKWKHVILDIQPVVFMHKTLSFFTYRTGHPSETITHTTPFC